MILIIIWVIFIVFISASQELSQLCYFVSSILLLGFTYAYNQTNFVDFSLKFVIGLLSLPSTLFWYVAFVYNNFLSLTPIDPKIFMNIAFVYLYIVLYIFCK
jgi:hypothetical protein